MIFFIGKNKRRSAEAVPPYREEYVRINGISTYLLHYPSAPEAPLILHIHGGPGAPASAFAYLTETFPRNYSIVYYDQRGAGKTLIKNPFAKVSVAALKQDLLETVLHLKRTYQKEKICILGHSWGSVLGSSFVLDHPEHVSCYIGCGQMCCFAENEKRAYSFLRDAVLQSGDEKAWKALMRLGPYPAKCFSLNALLNVVRMRNLQGRFGLAVRMDEEAKQIFRQSPVAGRIDMIAFTLGGLRSAGMMKEFWNNDLRSRGYVYQAPVYYIMGDQDRTTPYEIAQEYFDRIEAPFKKWYFVPNAGHFAMLDNTEAWRHILNEVVCTQAAGSDKSLI